MDIKLGIGELFILPQYLQPEMVHVIIQLAEHGDVEAAICNNPYLIHLLQSMEQDERYQITGKITLNRPVTCLELTGLLDRMHPNKAPFLLLDFFGGAKIRVYHSMRDRQFSRIASSAWIP